MKTDEKFIKLAILLTILMAALGSCSPKLWSSEWHIKRALQKDPSLYDTTARVARVDTIIREIPAASVGFFVERDTIIQIRDSIQREISIKYVYIPQTDTSQAKGELEVDCPPEKIVEKVIEKPVPQLVYVEPSFWQRAEWMVYLLIAVIIALILWRVYKTMKLRSRK